MTIRNIFVGNKNPVRKISAYKVVCWIGIAGIFASGFVGMKYFKEAEDRRRRGDFFDPKSDLTEKDINERIKYIKAVEKRLQKFGSENKQSR